MDIPLELRLTLRAGTVYYLEHRDLDSAEPHYFIVLNSDPLTQRVLLMSVVTSKLEKQKRRIQRSGHPPETLVVLDPKDYSELTQKSCVNCNRVFSKPLAELVAQLSTFRKKPLDLPQDLLEQIIHGVKASPEVAEEEKDLLRKPRR